MPNQCGYVARSATTANSFTASTGASTVAVISTRDVFQRVFIRKRILGNIELVERLAFEFDGRFIIS
jgi:hypothetical protein